MQIAKINRRFFIGAMASVAKVRAAVTRGKVWALAIHGGAGTIRREELSPEREREYHETLRESLRVGGAALEEGRPSLDAVGAAIRVLEDSPLFNAGKGAVFNSAGQHELDASIMEGAGLRAGAVAGVRGIRNPIDAARTVMDNSPHVMLIAQGAEEFARQHGIAFAAEEYFFDERRWKQFLEAKSQGKQALDHSAGVDGKFGTVGAVALDQSGTLAAGTSTGGMTNKKFGRVGDSPIIGAGTWADNLSCAISCTGHGEYFIRTAAAHEIASLVAYRRWSVQRAADETLRKIGVLGGSGGAIALDARGRVAFSFNTTGMYRGLWRSQDQAPETHIFRGQAGQPG
jgi:beta-aspartyl-peptidase (threonine type)